jgi:protein SCO1
MNQPGAMSRVSVSRRRLARRFSWGAALLGLTVTAAGAQVSHDDHRAHAATPSAPADQPVVGSLSIPEVSLLNQEGQEVRFYSDLVKGKVVAINFVFTTCTTICPPMGANFAGLQRLLRNRGGREVHLISVSVDPAVDTPARLKNWASRFGAGPGWTLVTGPKLDVDGLLKALKVFTPDKNDHSPTVLVGDEARGVWTRIWGLARPAEMAKAIERVMDEPSGASGPGKGDRR